MSHDISHGAGPSGSTSPARLSPIISPPHDFTDATGASGLASALQDIAQALLSFSQICEASLKESVQDQAQQSLGTQKPTQPSPPIPRNSKRAKRTAKCQACAFNRYAPDALNDFAGKKLAKSFEEAYANGNFRGEIRYYFVPSHVVKFEHRLLHYHQQDAVLDMLLGVHTELDIRSKLLAYLTEETNLQGSSLAQVSESLLQPLRLLHTLHSHLSKHTLIHKEMLPHIQNS